MQFLRLHQAELLAMLASTLVTRVGQSRNLAGDLILIWELLEPENIHGQSGIHLIALPPMRSSQASCRINPQALLSSCKSLKVIYRIQSVLSVRFDF